MPNRSFFLIENDLANNHHGKRYRNIMLFCLVLGDNVVERFEIDIKIERTVSALQKAIKEAKKPFLDEIPYSKLKLWKVTICTKVLDKKMDILKTKAHDKIDIGKDLEGMFLEPDDEISDLFDKQLNTKQISIIVQPPLPATTGKRKLDLDDGNEDRDRKKGKLTVLETILTHAQKTMGDIMELSDDPKVYSNPENLLLLPFPFLGKRKPVERFSINDDNKFLYMGRKAFDDVLNIINGLKSGHGFMKCFIYGNIGYGKSYILATIVCFLLRTGKRAVYFPDCRELASDPEDYMKSALFLAYANDSVKISEIHACETLDEIVKFCKSSELLYIIVDQMNALDCHDDTEIKEAHKERIKDVLNKMTASHYYIKISSANNISAWHLMQKQTNERMVTLYGGLDKDEMAQWWKKHVNDLPSMDNEQRKKVKYITGQNPLFLSFLLGSKKNFEGAWDHLNQLLIEKVSNPMMNFSDIISNNERWDLHVKLMSLCMTNSYPPFGYGVADYDHRFFYINHNCCHYVSGFARDCMTDYLFEKGKLEVFSSSSWVQCIKKFKNNPSVKGFMVEKACLAFIFKNGLTADAISFKFDNYKFFCSINEIDFSTNEGLCTFYLPCRWNQKSINGLITLYQTKSKTVKKDTLYIAPIQIALSKETHSDSEASFFSGIWPELKLKISGDLKVEVIFIWITRENDVDYFVEANEKRLKGRTIEINPQYTSIVTAFRCINIELENILSY